MSVLLECQQVGKTYQDNGLQVPVLSGVDFQLNRAEQVAILGASGSGKSTLLHILGTLDTPTTGKVLFEGQDVFSLSSRQLAAFRNQSLGFVYQFHHLLPEFNALENVAMPLLIAKQKTDEAYQRARQLLDKVGLGKRVGHRPSQLSGGERQRVAIARALVNQPKLVLADEPTGNLDHKAGQGVFELLISLRAELQTSFVVVTHDNALASRFDRVVSISDGQLVSV